MAAADLDPDRRRRERREPRPTPSGRSRSGPAPWPASSSRRSAGRRRRSRSPRCCPSYLSSALDGPVGIAAAAQVAQTLRESAPAGGVGLAHGLATQRLFASTIAVGRVRAARRHAPPARRAWPRRRDRRARRSTPIGFSLSGRLVSAYATRQVARPAWTRPTPTPPSPRPSSRSWPAAGCATRSSPPARARRRWRWRSGASRRSR